MISRGLLAGFLLAATTIFPAALRAASSPAVDNMISKLPDPDQWSKSPLENALKDPDPIFKEPAFRQLVVSLKGRDPKGALESLRTLAAKFPDKPALQFLHGAFALSLKLYPEAETSFRKLIAIKAAAAGGWFGTRGGASGAEPFERRGRLAASRRGAPAEVHAGLAFARAL